MRRGGLAAAAPKEAGAQECMQGPLGLNDVRGIPWGWEGS